MSKSHPIICIERKCCGTNGGWDTAGSTEATPIFGESECASTNAGVWPDGGVSSVVAPSTDGGSDGHDESTVAKGALEGKTKG